MKIKNQLKKKEDSAEDDQMRDAGELTNTKDV